MRRIISFTLAFIAGIALYAQPGQGKQPEHLDFNGVPMDRTVTQFKINMGVRGFTFDKESSAALQNTAVFEGNYCGYNTVVYALYIPGSRHVYEVQACLPYTSRNMAESQWQWFKDQYEKKIVNSRLGESQTTGQGVGPNGKIYYVLFYRLSKPQYASSSEDLGTMYMYIDHLRPGSNGYTDEDHAYNLVIGFVDAIHDKERSGK